jgi:siderophore synthetase component
MSQSSRQIAERATFQSFANCYMREIDAGLSARHGGASGVDCIEWALPSQHLFLRAEITSRSLCGPHRFGRAWCKGTSEIAWRPVALVTALQFLVHEMYRRGHDLPADTLQGLELELLLRVLQSYRQTMSYLDAGAEARTSSDRFIDAEQSLVFGHWMHPTPKSLQGMSAWQQPSYAPEFAGEFQLHFFAARTDFVRHASARAESAVEIIEGMAKEATGLLRDGETLIPMHPLQAEALRLDADVQSMLRSGLLRDLGACDAPFTATSSVRTVYSRSQPWMLKFSLPVQITNSLRRNRRHELDAGIAIAKLFDRAGISERYPNFRIIHDPAYITLDIPDLSESGFEVILRENPFVEGHDAGMVTAAALTADPLPGQPSRLDRIITGLATRSGKARSCVALTWFERYLDHALVPLVKLYDEFGIALEAHQQNSILDISAGYPGGFYYRDNQGFYLSNRYRPLLMRHVPETAGIASLYFDDAEIRNRFAYYLAVNQIFSLISRMGHDGLQDESALLLVLRSRLEQLSATLSGAGRDFARHLLDRPVIATKTNLMARLLDIDELQSEGGVSLYRDLPNPLFAVAASGFREGNHAIAS